MHRKIAFSAKQKKAQLQEKRAIKRGDIEPLSHQEQKDRKRKNKIIKSQIHGIPPPAPHAPDQSRKFMYGLAKLPQKFLEETQILASTVPLLRPIPSESAILYPSVLAPTTALGARDETGKTISDQLTCPKRPKWRYDMTKNEVEKNERVWFQKWLDQTDTVIHGIYDGEIKESSDGIPTMPHAPTSFERNLDVWRQLWRVTEIAQVVLILLDSRCPVLHYPPSLANYMALPHIANRSRTILVLTKVDIAGPARAEAWTRYLKNQYPTARVVQVESYTEKDSSSSGERKRYEPHIPTIFRHTLVEALKEAHEDLLKPPERLKDRPEALAKWRPSVKRDIDWNKVLSAKGAKVGATVGGAAVPHAAVHNDDSYGPPGNEDEDNEGLGPQVEPEFLTVGLIGQPNVGKSSLLNALFGVPKVKASTTPGKTKHFQTLFWTPDVRLVDCPGLVMPNVTPMELQVLTGILPISRIAAIPLCIHYAAQLLPLEKIFGLEHPAKAAKAQEAVIEDKRTWREPRISIGDDHSIAKEPVWTAMDILAAYAVKKGWVTAKTGRPDINRAGNSMLRALAEARIRWAFRPEGTHSESIGQEGNGVWLPGDNEYPEHEFDSESEEEESASDVDSEDFSEAEGESDNEDESTTVPQSSSLGGRFSALALEDSNSEIDEGVNS
ncbi:Ras GTPase GNL1-like protein [Abortiporus biennis]